MSGVAELLKLPIKKQKEFAENDGMSLKDWQAHIQKYVEQGTSDIETVHLKGKEAEEYLEEHGDFYQRCFS